MAFLDIGQGDAIYIQAPNGRQMVVDGGPKETLMARIPEHMTFSDKTIDILVVTNPDLDHYSGFLPLLDMYEIGAVVEPGTTNDFGMYRELQDKIEKENVPHILAKKGQRIILDAEKNVYFEILFPDRNVSSWDPNDGSIIGMLVYGDTSFLLTGDATALAEGIVVAGSDVSDVDVLKIAHHGSKTSSGLPLLREASPDLAVISAGKDNRYGHPAKMIIDRLRSLGIPYLVTHEEGGIVCTSDGIIVSCK